MKTKDWLRTVLWPRVTFQRRLATGMLVLALLLWYLVQLWAVEADWDIARVRWWFTTAAYPSLSPGLVLASLSHSFVSVQHLLANVATLWLVGGDSEQHMRRFEVVGFFIVTGVAAVVIATALTGQSTMGASGAVFAFVGFYCVHTAVARRDAFPLSQLGSMEATATSFRALWFVILATTPVVLAIRFLGQWGGIVPVDRGDPVGHFVGLLCGCLYAVCRTGYRRV